MDNRDDNDQSPMQRLIQYVPDAAMKVLDQCVTRSHEDQHHPDMKVTFLFMLLLLFLLLLLSFYYIFFYEIQYKYDKEKYKINVPPSYYKD